MNANNHWMVLLNPTDIVKNLPSLKQATIRSGCMSSRYWKYDKNGESDCPKMCLNAAGIRLRRKRKTSTRRRPVDQLALDGSYIATYRSMSSAAKALGIKQASISNVCHGKQGKTGGYTFQFHDASSAAQKQP
ncbi:MAG: hypothetical protein IPJ05_02710 [Nitrosomonas sp.]|nr:hypothetical protein [Nitrosomonas sp.]